MTLTPKQSFKESTHSKGWQDLVSSDQFQSGATAALLTLAFDVAGQPEAGLRIQGAKMFLENLMKLAEEVKQQPRAQAPQLVRT